LIHKDPFDDGTELQSLNLRVNEGPNTDPDSWTGWSDLSTGTKGVDYDWDVSTYSRHRDLTSSGRSAISSTTSTDLESFVICRDLHLTTTRANSDIGYLYCYAWRSGPNRELIILQCDLTQNSTYWLVAYDGGAYYTTSKPFGTRAHVWLYSTNGKCAAWFDDDASAEFSGINWTLSGSPPFITLVTAGKADASGGNTTDITHSTILAGGMTTA
jgi:hypothetical protein